MRARSMVLAALGAVFVLGAVAPASADDDDWGRGRHEWREHQWRRHEWREHEWREHHPRYYGPPVGYYYAPPPVYYTNPGVSFGFTVR